MLNKIEIVRGTTNTIQIKVYDANGAEYDLAAGERLVFGVKKRAEDEAIIIEKTGEIIGSGLFNVLISPEDTEGLDFGQYIYDVGIGNGSDFYNVIKASPFTIAPNVTSRGGECVIELTGQVRVRRLTGTINIIPSESGGGGPLQAKTVYPSHSEQVVSPDEDYYGLVSVTVKAVPRVPACVTSVESDVENLVETIVNIGATVDVSYEEVGANPIINISMSDGSNLGIGGSDYAATLNGGYFSNEKYVIDSSGYLTVPTPFMAGTGEWTVAFKIDAYTVSSANFSTFAGGTYEVPGIFYTYSHSKSQAKLAKNSANTKYLSWYNSAFVTTDSSNGACYFSVQMPTTFVFRNNGSYISLWVNGVEILREESSRYEPAKYASNFYIGDNYGGAYSMSHMECSMLRLWDRALSDLELRSFV